MSPMKGVNLTWDSLPRKKKKKKKKKKRKEVRMTIILFLDILSVDALLSFHYIQRRKRVSKVRLSIIMKLLWYKCVWTIGHNFSHILLKRLNVSNGQSSHKISSN